MTPQERLDKKFKEVLEKRGELADRMQLQEDAMLAAERVMDIFGHTMNGEKVQEVLMYKLCGYFCFEVRVANGTFKNRVEDDLPNELEESLRLAEYAVAENIKDWMLEILDKYFAISEESGIIISI